MVTDFASENTRKLRVFLYNSKCGSAVKLETNIVEKHLFVVKEKTTYYTLPLNDHATIVNVTFCNQRFPWLLVEARM